MRMPVIATLLAASAALAAAQTTSTEKPPKTKRLTLVGCVAADETNNGQLTFVDEKDGTEYRLSGTDARDYVGKRVQIVGATNPNKVHVRGGLVPGPNVAAQAGAIDPTKAAMAAQGANRGTGPAEAAELPEFKVNALKGVKGSCPDSK